MSERQGTLPLVSKYDPLRELLRRQNAKTLTLTFDQINDLVPGGLPSSAYRHRPWWGNDSSGGHVQAAAWGNAGWAVDDIDPAAQTVTFTQVQRGALATWAEVFERQPAHWGLRGDPYVWQEMAERLRGQPVPATRAQSLAVLLRTFADVVGVEVDEAHAGDNVYCEGLAHGGMSSGQVHLVTWRERLLPKLASRAGDSAGE